MVFYFKARIAPATQSGGGEGIDIAIACYQQAVESSAPALGHSDVRVLMLNVKFLHRVHALVHGC